MEYPQDLRYTQEHEWVRIDGERATVGITHHAQDQLGDVVFVEHPALGAELQAGGAFAAVESVKAVSDVYAPISGKVLEVNDALLDAPHGEGWLVRMTVANPAELASLLDAAQYARYAAAEVEG